MLMCRLQLKRMTYERGSQVSLKHAEAKMVLLSRKWLAPMCFPFSADLGIVPIDTGGQAGIKPGLVVDRPRVGQLVVEF